MKHVLFISLIILFIVAPGVAVAEEGFPFAANASVDYCNSTTPENSEEWTSCMQEQRAGLLYLLDVLDFAMDANILSLTNSIFEECIKDNTISNGGVNFAGVARCVDNRFGDVAEELIEQLAPKTDI